MNQASSDTANSIQAPAQSEGKPAGEVAAEPDRPRIRFNEFNARTAGLLPAPFRTCHKSAHRPTGPIARARLSKSRAPARRTRGGGEELDREPHNERRFGTQGSEGRGTAWHQYAEQVPKQSRKSALAAEGEFPVVRVQYA